jgi:choline dehydrogenase-like flavoprotein
MEKNYDAIVIGAGVAGGLIANELSKAGYYVLILEAGVTGPKREELVGNYIKAPAKTLASPYNVFPAGVINKAPSPDNTNDYYDQPDGKLDPMVFKSTYERRVGGSTWHWLGNCPRLLPNDFKTYSLYNIGVDWPITYTDLENWYVAAEKELGVAGDHEALNGYLGAFRTQPFPMQKIWPSYSDLQITEKLRPSAHLWSEFNDLPFELVSTPQARNSSPYDGRPVCAGNSTCVPICPIGAKYDATVHINKAQKNGAVLREQSIVTNIFAEKDGQITGVTYQTWDQEKITVHGKVYVLAANAIESAKILLMSEIANSSDQVGRNLMDHPQGEGLCVSKEPLFPFRGPPTTSGIDKFRDGEFRRKICAFRLSMGNDGGGRSQSPQTILNTLVQQSFGTNLKNELREKVIRQFRISFLAEMLPSSDNRITLSDQLDVAGIPRPKLAFKVDQYTMNSFEKISEIMKSIFIALGSKTENIKVPDHTTPFLGAGHVMGTCRMGNDPKSSVVDSNCRSHDHKNLFIAGASVFPTGGSANPTLTIAALSLRLAATIIENLALLPKS